jgi:ketosteroid isomerase-like protein
MKKPIILNLSFLFFAATFCGCQTPVEALSDEQLIDKTMVEWEAAFEAGDLNRLIALFSEDYVSSSGSSKLAMRERMAGAIQRGALEDAKVGISGAELTIIGNTASYGPVKITTDKGTLALEYTLRKENGKWLIVSSKRVEDSSE